MTNEIMEDLLEEPVLCYVDLPWVYFTNCPLSEQWGDDWNDVPYEHNAGDPYEREPYDITKVAIDGWSWQQPCEGHYNSPYSVQDINAGAVAWLRDPYEKPPVEIPAGTTLKHFMAIMKVHGTSVFTEVNE